MSLEVQLLRVGSSDGLSDRLSKKVILYVITGAIFSIEW